MPFLADICHASGKFFRAVLDFRSFYTAWKAGIQRIKRALRAPCKGAAGRPALQGARSALYLRGIPAFAGMTRGGAGMTRGEAGRTECRKDRRTRNDG